MAWHGLLDACLPRRYEVLSKVFAVDHLGGVSQEIDIVIADRHYSPLGMKSEARTVIPIEAIYAGIEVKPTLDKRYVTYAGEKVASLRRLTRTSAPIVDARGHIDTPRQPLPIMGLLLTASCSWQDLDSEPFRRALDELPSEGRLDLGCVANAGGWSVEEESGLTVWGHDEGLLRFWLRLLGRLQRLGTVPAMDFNAWGGR